LKLTNDPSEQVTVVRYRKIDAQNADCLSFNLCVISLDHQQTETSPIDPAPGNAFLRSLAFFACQKPKSKILFWCLAWIVTSYSLAHDGDAVGMKVSLVHKGLDLSIFSRYTNLG
jgi:hypothetical protein